MGAVIAKREAKPGLCKGDEGGHTHDKLLPALDRVVVRDTVISPAQLVFGLLEAVLDLGPPAVEIAHRLGSGYLAARTPG